MNAEACVWRLFPDYVQAAFWERVNSGVGNGFFSGYHRHIKDISPWKRQVSTLCFHIWEGCCPTGRHWAERCISLGGTFGSFNLLSTWKVYRNVIYYWVIITINLIVYIYNWIYLRHPLYKGTKNLFSFAFKISITVPWLAAVHGKHHRPSLLFLVLLLCGVKRHLVVTNLQRLRHCKPDLHT